MHHPLAWSAPASPPRNVGYIGSFWAKIDRWDNASVRKAGGVFPRDDADLGFATFTIANASSVMALIRAVCGAVMRANACPLPLAIDFMSLKITWLFSAQATQMCAKASTSIENCYAPPPPPRAITTAVRRFSERDRSNANVLPVTINIVWASVHFSSALAPRVARDFVLRTTWLSQRHTRSKRWPSLRTLVSTSGADIPNLTTFSR